MQIGGESYGHIHWQNLKVLALVPMVLVLVLIILASGLLVLALVLKVLTALALILMILAQSYHIFTDGFWGYLQSQKKAHTHWLTHWLNNIGLRDASASKNWGSFGHLGLRYDFLRKKIWTVPLILQFNIYIGINAHVTLEDGRTTHGMWR